MSAVVVAYSPDEYGAAAVEHGARHAREGGVPLVVVNATRGDAPVDRRFAHDADIAGLEARLRDEGIDVTVRHDVVPDVAEAVLAVAREAGAALVVVGIRRRTPVGKLLLGSVAQRVILEAECPVLAVKPAQD
ncbi:MAG TPA: universal stress protein [Acidimicrobiales bacterium]